eukprot:scaffold43261_cov85-Phaeocystis_antarctica.AAC.2
MTPASPLVRAAQLGRRAAASARRSSAEGSVSDAVSAACAERSCGSLSRSAISRNSTKCNPQSQLVARCLKCPPPAATSHTFRLFSLNNIHV